MTRQIPTFGHAAVVGLLLVAGGVWWDGSAPQVLPAAASALAASPSPTPSQPADLEPLQGMVAHAELALGHDGLDGDIAASLVWPAKQHSRTYRVQGGVYELAMSCQGSGTATFEILPAQDDTALQTFTQPCVTDGTLVDSGVARFKGAARPVVVRATNGQDKTIGIAWRWTRIGTTLPPADWRQQVAEDLPDQEGQVAERRRMVSGEPDSRTVRLQPGEYSLKLACTGDTWIQLMVVDPGGTVVTDLSMPCVGGTVYGTEIELSQEEKVQMIMVPQSADKAEAAWIIAELPAP